MSFSIGMWVRDTALKLRQQGIELDKLAINKIGKTQDIYTSAPEGNQWKMKIGNSDEDLTWLIK